MIDMGSHVSRRRGFFLGAAGALIASESGPAIASAPPPLTVKYIFADPGIFDHGKLIQSAINDVEAAGGGRVELAAGTFNCPASSLYLDPTKTSLIGAHSILNFANAHGQPAGIIVKPGLGASQYGQATQRIEGIGIAGPGAESSMAGIVFSASIPGFSSRISLYNIEIHDFGTGIQFSDRSYLIQVYNSAIRNCKSAIKVPSNLIDAGENVSFFGCTLSASDIAVDNTGGFEIDFFGTSFDFVKQWYSGSGTANFYGCHFETGQPESSNALFNVLGDGIVNFHGGTMMVSGNKFDASPQNGSIFNLQGVRSRAVLNDVALYNLRSANGALASGNGRLVTRGLCGGPAKQLDPITMRTSQADLFGGGGMFTAQTLQIETDVTSNQQGDVSRYHAQFGAIALSQGHLAINKNGGIGNELSVRLFCPIGPLKMPSVHLNWTAVGMPATTPAKFWISVAAVQKIGIDTLGRAIIGATEPMGPLATLYASADSIAADLSINTLEMQSGSQTDGYTSEWVTHLCITLELIELPENSGILINHIQAYAL